MIRYLHLQIAWIPYQLVSFEHGNHGIMAYREEVQKLIQEWFDRYVKNLENFNEISERKVVK